MTPSLFLQNNCFVLAASRLCFIVCRVFFAMTLGVCTSRVLLHTTLGFTLGIKCFQGNIGNNTGARNAIHNRQLKS